MRVDIHTQDRRVNQAKALIENGCTANYISEDIIHRYHLRTQQTNTNVEIYTGHSDTPTQTRPLQLVTLQIPLPSLKTTYKAEFIVAKIPVGYDIVFGIPFYAKYDPEIDYSTKPPTVLRLRKKEAVAASQSKLVPLEVATGIDDPPEIESSTIDSEMGKSTDPRQGEKGSIVRNYELEDARLLRNAGPLQLESSLTDACQGYNNLSPSIEPLGRPPIGSVDQANRFRTEELPRFPCSMDRIPPEMALAAIPTGSGLPPSSSEQPSVVGLNCKRVLKIDKVIRSSARATEHENSNDDDAPTNKSSRNYTTTTDRTNCSILRRNRKRGHRGAHKVRFLCPQVVDHCRQKPSQKKIEKEHRRKNFHSIYITHTQFKKQLRQAAGTQHISDSIDPTCLFIIPNDAIVTIAHHLQKTEVKHMEKAARFADARNAGFDKYKDRPELHKFLLQYKDTLFRAELPKQLPPKRDTDMNIELTTSNPQNLYHRQFRLSPAHQAALEKWVEQMVERKLIEPSNAPYAAPTFVVPKQGTNEFRIVHDYRELNKVTKRMSAPLLQKDDIIDQVQGGFYFTTVDLRHSFYQIRLHESCRPYTTFHARNNLYQYVVCPMGLKNSPAALMSLTSKLFRSLSHTNSFYDDIYIVTKEKSLNSHIAALKETFDILVEAKLYIKIEKCIIASDEIPLLGDYCGRKGIRTDPDKVKAIQEWPVPKTFGQLHSFLGLTGYLQRYVKLYAEYAGPLHQKLSTHNTKGTKSLRLRLSDNELQKFNALKSILSSPPVLKIPDFQAPFYLKTDGSGYAIGSVLYQLEDGVERPIAYFSKRLSPAQRNYTTQQQELLAIIESLEKFRVYCLDQPVRIYTDHQALINVLSQRKINRRIARWYDTLAEYSPTFVHIKGELNVEADALSRRNDHEAEVAFTELEIAPIEQHQLHAHVQHVGVPSSFLNDLKASYTTDPFVQRLTRAIDIRNEIQRLKHAITVQNRHRTISVRELGRMKGKLKLLKTRGGKLYHSYHYTTDNVLMYQPRNAEPRIFIPTAALRARLLREVHDAGGHYGRDLTYLKLTDRFYWPKMFIDAQTYTADCLVCQRNRARNRPPAGHIDPLTIPQQRWRDITMDIIPGLPTTQAGYDAIWTIVDRMTRRAHFIPIALTMDAEEAARIFFDVYYRLHGIPQSIVSDREPRWLNLFWSEVLRRTGTTLNTTVAYRPQADGLSERYNRTVESYLRHYVNFEQTDWDQHLSTAEYTINATVNSAIGCAPFELDLGYVPAAPIDTVLPPNNNDARTLRGAHFINRLEALRIRCRDQLLQAQERMRHNANRGIDDLQFAVGDQVLLEVSRINPAHLPSHRKLGPRRIGPYRILRKIGAKAYKLNLPTGCRLHPVFDVDSLTPYRIAQRAQSAIPTMLEDGTEGYLVERIIGRRIHRGVVQYQVKWLGPADDITWEPVENLRGVPDAITEFHNSAPNVHNQRPRRRRRRT